MIKITDIETIDPRLKSMMRTRDAELQRDSGFDPDHELSEMWRESTIRKLISDDNDPICIHMSRPYVEMGSNCALWSLVTFNFVNDHPAVFIKNTRPVIRKLFSFEPTSVDRSFSVIPVEFKESINWHKRIVMAREVMTFAHGGKLHTLMEMRRSLWQ